MRILILEDEPLVALDLQCIVESRGYEVAGVCSSLAEIKKFLKSEFDFALLDIDVTDGKSFDIASELQSRQIPFAFVSGSKPGELPNHLRSATFIPKPFAESTILKSIANSNVDPRSEDTRAKVFAS